MTAAPRRWRSTIRVRLTVLYAGAFFLAGAALIGALYFFLDRALAHQETERVGVTQHLSDSADGAHLTSDVRAELHEQFREDRDDTLDTMLVVSLGALGVLVAGAGASGWFLAGRALHPLHLITGTARRVADRSLHERIALEGPDDEIKQLADTFDAMLERLDRSFDSQRRFVANASHELRTPLTINRTLIEVALEDPTTPDPLRQLGATLLEVNKRHERLIDGLLTLASSEQGITEQTIVDLADVVRHLAVESADMLAAAGIELHAELKPAAVAGDPVLLERLVQNLLDNAIRYNIPGDGTIEVSSGTADGLSYVTVENTGPAVPAYEIPNLFDPFHRLTTTERLADPPQSSSRRGAGLGLSIVRSVAQAHGGNTSALPREGGGLVIHVRVPAQAARRPPPTSG